ncbi:enoyl-CoA hydratase/isomerase family protein [Halovivax limisalsi]|uniref:enoyl-CoA hydratase/isomerase family protein n=1 Tax=Halovivax limisalsi TaxID=1453760 RepID=UPI001FFD5E35|nr:enoyl-CoA hydratase-related protein [Halovivax limisalsi]
MGTIRVEHHEEDPIATVVISNPERRNAISREDAQALADAFREIDADDSVRAAVLTGEGDAFCAGIDVTSVEGEPTADLIDRSFHAAVREIATCSVPVVARLDGPAVGAGASLAVACDLVYADADARIGFSFVRIGLTADTGATWLLPRLVDTQTAFELLASGRILDAPEAADLGLVTETTTDLDAVVDDRVTDLANGPTRAISSIRRLVRRASSNTLEEQLEAEARAQLEAYHTADSSEGMAAFLEDREPAFEGR